MINKTVHISLDAWSTDYNKYHCRLRIGLLIRPNFFSEF
jgi:hypothetical protein